MFKKKTPLEKLLQDVARQITDYLVQTRGLSYARKKGGEYAQEMGEIMLKETKKGATPEEAAQAAVKAMKKKALEDD